MIKNIIKIEGMACGMCEAHVCDAIRKAFPDAKKVSASHGRREASFLSEGAVDAELLKQLINETGYHYISASAKPYKKKGFFGFL